MRGARGGSPKKQELASKAAPFGYPGHGTDGFDATPPPHHLSCYRNRIRGPPERGTKEEEEQQEQEQGETEGGGGIKCSSAQIYWRKEGRARGGQ
uniref:Uncharacterized protein n=1 Tax=Oryza brachyantha TaxID=4533 RepID=J3MML7_ORYBR